MINLNNLTFIIQWLQVILLVLETSGSVLQPDFDTENRKSQTEPILFQDDFSLNSSELESASRGDNLGSTISIGAKLKAQEQSKVSSFVGLDEFSSLLNEVESVPLYSENNIGINTKTTDINKRQSQNDDLQLYSTSTTDVTDELQSSFKQLPLNKISSSESIPIFPVIMTSQVHAPSQLISTSSTSLSSYIISVTSSPSLQAVIASSEISQAREYHGLNTDVGWLKELDELDEYMVKISKFEFVCGKPQNLSYCTTEASNTDVPKDLSEAVYFQDSMARAAVETLSILTKGETTSCEKHLKKIFCRQKFPSCNEFLEAVTWHPIKDCRNKIQQCSLKAQETLNNMRICEKLSQGASPMNKCIPYMRPEGTDHCQLKNVSVWLFHAGVEINSMLNFQFSLNDELTEACKNTLTNYLCYSGLRCHTEEGATMYRETVGSKCSETVKSCKNQTLSAAIKDLFLKCERYQ